MAKMKAINPPDSIDLAHKTVQALHGFFVLNPAPKENPSVYNEAADILGRAVNGLYKLSLITLQEEKPNGA